MPDNPQRSVSVAYRRTVGDGSFGSESAEVNLQWFLDEDDDSHTDLEFAQDMLRSAREIVFTHLRASLSANVRKAVTQSIAPARTAATVPTDEEEALPF